MTHPPAKGYAELRQLIAQRLKQHRADHGLTLRQFALRSGIGIAQILDLESEVSNPTLATLVRLAQALGITLAELVTPDAS